MTGRASLAEGIPADLSDTLTCLDNHNATLVAPAVEHATGHHR